MLLYADSSESFIISKAQETKLRETTTKGINYWKSRMVKCLILLWERQQLHKAGEQSYYLEYCTGMFSSFKISILRLLTF